MRRKIEFVGVIDENTPVFGTTNGVVSDLIAEVFEKQFEVLNRKIKMATEVQTKLKDLITAVNAEDYYVEDFAAVMDDHKMSLQGVANDEYTDRQIILMVNDFWDGLADSPVIRRFPFFQVCDIAEMIFDIDEEPDEA